MVTNLVVTKMFPKMKFIQDKVFELAYTEKKESICGFVINNCTIPDGVNKESWWANARKWVNSTLTRLRNDRNSMLKWAFYGKFEKSIRVYKYLANYYVQIGLQIVKILKKMQTNSNVGFPKGTETRKGILCFL